MPTDHSYFSTVRDPPVNGHHALLEGATYQTGGDYEGYMVVPIRWGDGTTVTWQAIAVEPYAVSKRAERHPKAAQSKLYPPDAPVDRVVYGHHRAKPGMVLVVSEGIFDVWRTWDAIDSPEFEGYGGLGALTNRVSEPQGRILRHLRPAEVVALHDNEDKPDPPGHRLVLDLGAALGYTVPLSVASVPKGCDPDDAGVEGIRAALRSRISYGRWAALWATRSPSASAPLTMADIFP